MAIDYLVFFLLIATLGVLMFGVINMMRGGDARRGNRLMVWRVALQAAAILLAALFVMGK